MLSSSLEQKKIIRVGKFVCVLAAQSPCVHLRAALRSKPSWPLRDISFGQQWGSFEIIHVLLLMEKNCNIDKGRESLQGRRSLVEFPVLASVLCPLDFLKDFD